MKKLFSLTAALLLITLLSYSADAQTRTTTTTRSKVTYPYLEIAPNAGFLMPVGVFADQYKASPKAGLDFTYRVNKEVGIFGSASYNSLQNKNESLPSSSHLELSVGPRYYFTHPRLSSKLFIEGGVGAYIFNSPAYSITVNDVTQDVAASTDTRMGANTGLGGSIFLSQNVDLFLRGKYNMIFREGGTSSYISSDAGVTVRF
jgi:hypothetical protein